MKTVIITGGNSGLGYACAREIARDRNWHIILACRNSQRANEAVTNLKDTAKSNSIEAINLDLANMASIRSFAAELSSRHLSLNAIVCNAGVQFVRSQTFTKDGFDTTFGVNHLGHFLLINLLLPQLSTPARIIFVSSDTHDSSKTTGMPAPYFRDSQLMAYPYRDPTLKNKSIGELGRIAYTTSKLCNILCAYELSHRLQQQNLSSITVNVFNPGLMPGSGLAGDYTTAAKFVWHNILPIFARFVPQINTIDNAGQALARLVLAPELDKTTGKYFSGLKMVDSSQDSYDRAKARQLWQSSVELTQLKPEETIFELD